MRWPNRDYTKSITWTYELNKDVYSIYIKAKANGQGYVKRMKEMWDIVHPDLNITAKNLRERAIRVIEKKLIRETGQVTGQQENAPTQARIEEHTQFISPQDNTQDGIHNENPVVNNANEEQHVQEPTPNEHREGEKYKQLKEKYFTNFNKFKSCKLEERRYRTKIDRKISAEDLAIVDMIVEDQLDEMTEENGISLWDINVILYSTAITILEQQGKLKENRSFDQRNNKPGLQVQLEQKIEAIRKRLAFIDVILKCKQEGKFTKHQPTIEQKLKKWYQKITCENLESIRAELKHELRTCTSKLKKRRTVEQRDCINKQFSLN